MIDTHCHLTFPELADHSGVLARAAQRGVRGCISISTTTHDCLDALAVARAYEQVWCTSGVHPLYADKGVPHEWANLRRVAEDERCVAWGELGLDQHYEEPGQASQRALLDEQLAHIERWRREDPALRALPVVVHCREAFTDLIPILRSCSIPPERFVFHCFTAGPEEARAVLDFGAMISFTGVVTFKNASDVRAAAALVPLDRVMVETDAPFLTPAPHRKVWPNEPAYSRDIADFLARDIFKTEAEVFDAAVAGNVERFFGIAEPVRTEG